VISHRLKSYGNKPIAEIALDRTRICLLDNPPRLERAVGCISQRPLTYTTVYSMNLVTAY